MYVYEQCMIENITKNPQFFLRKQKILWVCVFPFSCGLCVRQAKNKRENENFIHRNCDEFIKDFRDFREINILIFFCVCLCTVRYGKL